MEDDDAPWSAGGTFGKTGQPSGIFNTYAIPFTTVRVTVTLLNAPEFADTAAQTARYAGQTTSFWIILRGETLLGIPSNPTPIQFTLPGSGTALPQTARLRTQENSAVQLAPGDYLELVKSSSNAGAVFMIALQVASGKGETFLEGCFRVTDPVSKQTTMLLSSGTEDYFLGTYCEISLPAFHLTI